MRLIALLRLFARLEAQFALEYRTNLFFDLLQQVMVIVTSIGAVLVLFSYTQEMNGWTLPQMLVLIGVYYIVQGCADLVFVPSVTDLLEQIRLGTLDFVLLKPVDAQIFVSVRRMRLTELGNIMLGLGIVAAGFARLPEGVAPLGVLTFAATLVCGLALVYSLLIALGTLAFWFVRVENLLTVYEAATDAARFPIDLYPGWLRLTLSTIVPIGIAVTVPAQAVAGRLEAAGFATVALGAVAALLATRWFWRRGLRSYTGASA